MSRPWTTIADIDCIELVELVTEYLDAALPDTDRARFEHHVGECPGCVEILEQFRAVIATHRRAAARPTPPTVDARGPRAAARRCSATGRPRAADATRRSVTGMAPRTLTPGRGGRAGRARDTLGIPLGPGQPSAFLHALGDRDDFIDLTVFGALLVDLYDGLHAARRAVPVGLLRTGRALPRRQRRADVEFIPADFRRFSRIAEQLSPRVVGDGRRRRPTPTATSRCHCTRARRSTRSTAPAPTRTACWWSRRTRSSRAPTGRTSHPHRVHVDEIDVHRRVRPRPVPAARRRADRRRPRHRRARPPAHPRRRDAPDRHRRDPVDRRRACSRTATAATTASTPRCSPPG